MTRLFGLLALLAFVAGCGDVVESKGKTKPTDPPPKAAVRSPAVTP